MFWPSVRPLTVRQSRSSSALELRQQRADAAGVEEILHQELRPTAARWRAPGSAAPVRRSAGGSAGCRPGAPSPRHGSWRWSSRPSPGGSGSRCRRLQAHDVGGLQILPDHLDDAPARGRAHARMAGVGGRDRGGAGQREAHGLGHARSWWRRCPWSCTCRRSGRCRSRSRSSPASVMLPACSSAQYFQLSEPEPRILPCQLPRSMAPAGTKIAGRFMEIAPMIRPGVVLSQPPISTAPSMRMAAQQLLGLHGQEVAVEHGRRLDERLATARSPAARAGSRRPGRRRA